MGFFEKLREGLRKTKNALFGRVHDLFVSMRKVDEDLLDELEEILITSDVGVETTEKIIAKLRRRIQENRITESEDAYNALKDVIGEMIQDGEPLDLSSKPAVILVIGVNCVGHIDAQWNMLDNFTLTYYGTESAKEKTTDIENNVAAAKVVKVEMIDATGLPVRGKVQGVTLIRTTLSNGKVIVSKVFNK